MFEFLFQNPTDNLIEIRNLVDQIDDFLPQTQCGQCGYPGCKPYAQAIANGDAINKCPPGGQKTINALANFLNVPTLPLDPEHGEESDVKKVAFIREDECIGCTKCIQACPVDAILGAAKQMHTVIADECTGCDLCVEPCPVDCIDMIQAETQLKKSPTIKADQLISSAEKELAAPEQACIRCGWCDDVCPSNLLPQQLFWYAKAENVEQLKAHKLFDCIECGVCTEVCPSNIPLTQYFRTAKDAIRQENKEKEIANRARKRFEFRNARIAKEEAEKEAKRIARKKAAEEARQKLAEQQLAERQTAEIKTSPTTIASSPTRILTQEEQRARLERLVAAAQNSLAAAQAPLVARKGDTIKPDQLVKQKARIKQAELKLSEAEKKLKEFLETKM